MKIYMFLLGFILLLLSACSSEEKQLEPIAYEFKEPTTFPFEVNEAFSEIDLEVPDHLHQFIYYYRNTETSQELKYILSKVLDEEQPSELEDIVKDMSEYKLDNGITVYYGENDTAQELWWEQDGFMARFIYFIKGNTDQLGEYKLEVEEFLKLANQVQ
ncbi:hypothetical protein ACFYKX_13140 [Cytobacillus sp. FJAT-54145]|uniref:DUF4367 domain-containing protein n=1 Tax=Cytobacillus spartinae TaxID=3299023 RepID=A0ABW6KFD3_9BACI